MALLESHRLQGLKAVAAARAAAASAQMAASQSAFSFGVRNSRISKFGMPFHSFDLVFSVDDQLYYLNIFLDTGENGF